MMEWIEKRWWSLLATAGMYLLCGLVFGAAHWVYQFFVDWPWENIIGAVFVVALVGFNWWQMDNMLWS